MNKKFLFSFLAASFLSLSSCSTGGDGGGGGGGGVQPEHDESEVEVYMDNLKATSAANHLYVHYYRYAQNQNDYNQWDIWSWAYSPKPGQGSRFDWNGRTTSADRMSASGNAIMDEFGYVTCDIDLTKKDYKCGWSASKKQMLNIPGDFYQMDGTTLDEQIGIQIVYTESRVTDSGFWTNDGGNVYVTLNDYALEGSNGTSYHVFVTQDKVQEPTTTPPTSFVDPFANDDGTNVTYGQDKFNDVDFSKTIDAKNIKTSNLFLNGDKNKSYLKYGAGVGYQIMVSSFADSDGDGMGDILGITQKIDYLKDLGVNVLWLTPIQLSDSYHGYDIKDYTQVDPKFGSKVSTHTVGGKPTCDSAMEDYKDLIRTAHENGMAVIMDLVLNHTSTTNTWFIKSAQLDDEYRGYYQWGNHETDTTGTITQEKCWYPYGDHHYSYYAKFGSSMPEINYANVSAREAVASMAKQWCEIGVDGFRMDAVKHIFMDDEVKRSSTDTVISDIVYKKDANGNYVYEKDANGNILYDLDDKGNIKVDEYGKKLPRPINYTSNLTKNLHFWKQLASDVKKSYPDCFFVGENFDGDAYNVSPFYEGFDSLFNFYAYFNITTLAAKASGNPNASGGPTSAHAYLSGSTDQKWDLQHVLASNNANRGGNGSLESIKQNGYTAIDGCFTSNHDIARTINRVAGSHSDSNGIDQQGNINTATEYAKYDKYSLLAQIVEIMLPGCTWIYYGDELGMTGNFPATDHEGQPFNSQSSYADLLYRQPMKWKQGGVVGDGSYTTGYEVTGSSIKVEWDSINASTAVGSVEAQKGSNGSHYETIKKFVNLKANTPALIKGALESYSWGSNNYVFNFHRVLGNTDYAIVVNMGNETLSAGFGGDGYKLAASYNGATLSSIPGCSVLVCYK